jgi:ABC-2 type transport system permease protein
MHKIKVMIRKEWSEVFKNRFVFFAVAFMPLLFTAMPLIILYSSRDSGESIMGMGEVPAEFSAMCDVSSGADCFQSFILSQFLMLFLMIPIIIPVTIASYSIVGEKTTRTLEPLLATPITTGELLAGKTLAATIPALAATWGSYLIFVIGTNIILSNPVVTRSLIEPLWLLAIFGVSPLLSIAGVSIAVMISSRVNDPRVAEQLSALVIMPLLLLFVGQTLGLIFVDQTVIIWIGLAMALIDAVLLYFASQIFQRETILTRWK